MTVQSSGCIIRRIRCPRHFIIKPGCRPYKMERNPRFKNLPNWAFEKFKIDRERPVKDKWGRPVRDDSSYYQPLVNATFALEHIYDPDNVDCVMKCRGRCLEGLGKVNLNAIRRLKRR